MQKVATLSAVPHDRGLTVKVGDTEVLLVRDGNDVRAYSAKCPHAGAPLVEGAICHGRLVCPWHKAAFQVSDGALVEPPALEGLKSYPVQLDGDNILVGGEPLAAATEPEAASHGVALIAGAGAAAAAAAAFLREFGHAGRIVLVGREPNLPYDRTALSKFVTAGEMRPDEVPPLLPEAFFAEHGIERVEADISALDATARVAVCGNGMRFEFDMALIATGATPVTLEIPGAGLDGVYTLRSRADAAAIIADVHAGGRAVVLGGGFISLEAACGLRAQGMAVTVVMPEQVPFARQFGSEIGLSIRALHELNGVRFYSGTQAARLEGEGRVARVVLQDGTIVPADLVLVGIGVRPATDCIQGVAREKDGGLAVDAGMRVAGQLFAAGDVACFPLAGNGRVRIEHWRVAQQQARVAARNMTGGDAVYDGVPFFWTYHYGKRFEYLGHADEWDQIHVEGDIGRQHFIALLCHRGTIRAAVACGRERETAVLIEKMRRPLKLTEWKEKAGWTAVRVHPSRESGPPEPPGVRLAVTGVEA